MDKRAPKNRNQPAQPVNGTRYRLLVPALVASILANVGLAVVVVRGFRSEERIHDDDATRARDSSPQIVVPPPLQTGTDPALSSELRPYAALGTFVAENNKIPALRWTEDQFSAFMTGLRSSYEGRGFPVDDEALKLRDQINAKVQAMISATEQNPIDEYFTTLREKEGVLRKDSGLHYRVTQEGQGAQATGEDHILVSYSARLPGGQKLPALSRERVRTAVGDLLPGLSEGVQLLSAGGKALVYLPPTLSFGEGRWPEGVPKGAPIIFFVELHEVTKE